MAEVKIKEDKASDEIYKSLMRMLVLCKKESEKGRFYIFTENHILEEMDLEKAQKASSLEESLQSLGKSTYHIVTGCDKEDRSIKIDGYPKLEIFFWPVLETILASDKPTLETVEEKIREVEGKAKVRIKNKESVGRKISEEEILEKILRMFEGADEKIFEKIMKEARERFYSERRIAEKGEGRDAEEFLDEVFDWIEKNTTWMKRSAWTWVYKPEEHYVDMSLTLEGTFKKSEFIDATEEVPSLDNKKIENQGINELKKKLRGRRIKSVCSSSANRWFLKILD